MLVNKGKLKTYHMENCFLCEVYYCRENRFHHHLAGGIKTVQILLIVHYLWTLYDMALSE